MSDIKPVLNLEKLETEHFSKGTLYESDDAFLSKPMGLTALGATYCIVPPGKTACPHHVHHVEDEMFVILSGTGNYRFGEQEYAVSGGDVLSAPIGGPEYAHQLINTGNEPLKYLALSSRSHQDVCEYPDSGKFMVRSGKFRYIGRQETNLDYWDGEKT